MSFFLPALARIKKNLGTGSPYDPPGLSGDPNAPSNADWTPSGRPTDPSLGSSPAPVALSAPVVPAARSATPIAAPDMAYAPPSASLPIQSTSQPDITRDVYQPQLQQTNERL